MNSYLIQKKKIISNMKQISIIIATFNAEKVLQRCLDSIFRQKTDEVELLIIDGDSKDNTMGIVENNKDNIDFYISERDNGLYDAWNKGIGHATGNWIVFLGSDDILLEGTISKQLNYIRSHRADDLDIISAKAWIVDESGNVLKSMGEPYSWRIFRMRMDISHGSTMHNRHLFEEVGLFDVNFRICGDYELLLRKKLNSAFIDDFFIQMQDGGMSTTLKARRESYLARKKNKSLSPIINYILSIREKWGYIIKHKLS